MYKFIRTAIAVVLTCCIVPSPAFGLANGTIPITPPKVTLTLSKPIFPAHADAPTELIASQGVPATEPDSGTADPAESAGFDDAALAAEQAAAGSVTHALDVGSSSGSNEYPVTAGDGKNAISFAKFLDGDLVVVLGGLSFGHAGIFDASAYSTLSSFAVISANVTPVDGVQREQCVKYRAYDRAYGLWVPGPSNRPGRARLFAQRQIGKPYRLSPVKTSTTSYYCSKLDWCAWYYTAKLDLDGDGGLYVWPVDLIRSPKTALFGFWN